MYISIPMMESLGPRLEWAQIWSQNSRSICGYWTRPIWGLKVNHRFHDKLRSELADHKGFPTVFHQFCSQGLVFLVVYVSQPEKKVYLHVVMPLGVCSCDLKMPSKAIITCPVAICCRRLLSKDFP
jgi:hypothetical protein